jgi:transcriptional regulator with XRE-family HTH domain
MPRPENDINPDASKQLALLASALRQVRHEAGLTIHQLATLCHYSVATLSMAGSGKAVPRWETVWSYAHACDPKADKRQWRAMWEAAKNTRPEKNHVVETTATVPSPRTSRTSRTPRSSGNRKSAWIRHQPPEPPAAGGSSQMVPSESLLELLREAAVTSERALNVPRVPADPMRTALGLCTTPADFTALLQQVRGESGLSLRELTHKSENLTTPISRSTASDILAGKRLPSTEQLHAFLLACDVSPENTLIWHHTITRLKISQIRHVEPAGNEFGTLATTLFRFTPDRHQKMMMVIGVVMLVFQVIQILGY